jgi:predicted site-specific integrase-resolvase
MILIPTLDGHEFYLYEKLDAQAYLGGISANTLARWRREGWIMPHAVVGRGYVYTKEALDECRKLRNLDVRNKEVEYA